MLTFDYTIQDELGIHARPAGVLAKTAKQFESTVKVAKNGKAADVRRMMSVMGLGIKCGETVTITVEGADEEAAFAAVKAFFEENL